MATTTPNRSSSSRSGNSDRRRSNDGQSAFSWGSTGAMIGAAAGGAALALAANLGRKFLVQSMVATDHWAESLALEHEEALAVFDKMLTTDDSQTIQRKLLLFKLSHALDKHAYAEEHVVYPALRESNEISDASRLEIEHGEVKEFLFRLRNMDPADPAWIDTVTEFRTAIEAHATFEEEEIFPRLRSEISDELDKRLTKEVAKASFMMA